MARIRIVGSGGNDTNLFATNPLYDTYEIYGLGGDDTLGGGAGGDYLDGGEGFDFASYQRAPLGVRVNMLDMAGNTGWAAGDEFFSIEGLIGSRYDDWLGGDNNNNIIDGWAGNDTVFAAGGNDVVRDRGGYDVFHGETDDFDPSAAAHPWAHARFGDILEYAADAYKKLGITADLQSGYVVEHSFATQDRIEGFEGIRATQFDDTLYGREESDVVLAGGAGFDVIYGRGGNDYISGGDDGDALNGEAGADYISGGNGKDVISGGRGNDAIYGDDGIDTVSYADVELVGTTSESEGFYLPPESEGFYGVQVNLGQVAWSGVPGNTAVVGQVWDNYPFLIEVETDTLSGIENAIGTRYRDVLSGSSEANVLDGASGSDVLRGLGGNDTLFGGQGNFRDELFGGANADKLDGGRGDDLLDGGEGGDQLIGGDGEDTVWYYDVPLDGTTFVVSLADPSLNTSWAQGDTYDGVENVVGTDGSDIIYGNGDDNVLDGREGSNTLYGNGGNDTLIGSSIIQVADGFHGGPGEDTVDYTNLYNPDMLGVTVDLLNPSLNLGYAAYDVLTSIENIFAHAGSTAGSVLSGNSADNEFRGTSGGDRFTGRGGNDTLWGLDGWGTDTAVFSGDVDDYAFRVLQFDADMGYERFLEVTDLTANRDGTDYVIGFEQLEFNGVVHNISEWIF
jgi:Ca2+-binding RTX toxin-like protein